MKVLITITNTKNEKFEMEIETESFDNAMDIAEEHCTISEP